MLHSISHEMVRAGRVLAKLKLAAHGVTEEQLASAAWPVASGATIARHTSVVTLIRGRLVIEVEDAIWQRQLWTLRSQILKRLEQELGKPLIQELEFRVSVPRRKPVQAAELSPAVSSAPTDEADGIRDPVLRSIYKAARRKATA